MIAKNNVCCIIDQERELGNSGDDVTYEIYKLRMLHDAVQQRSGSAGFGKILQFLLPRWQAQRRGCFSPGVPEVLLQRDARGV